MISNNNTNLNLSYHPPNPCLFLLPRSLMLSHRDKACCLWRVWDWVQKDLRFDIYIYIYIKMQHMGIRPYSCAECHSNFSWSSNLEKHVRIDTGEKRFARDAAFSGQVPWGFTGVKSHCFVRCVKCHSDRLQNWKNIGDATLEKGHLSVMSVLLLFHRPVTWKGTSVYTLYLD